MRTVFGRIRQVADDTVAPSVIPVPVSAPTPDGSVNVPPETYDTDFFTKDPNEFISSVVKQSRKTRITAHCKQHGVDPILYGIIKQCGVFAGGIMDEIGVEDLQDTESLTAAVISYLENETASETTATKSLIDQLAIEIPKEVDVSVRTPIESLRKVVDVLTKLLNKHEGIDKKYLGVHPQQLAYRASLLRRISAAYLQQIYVLTAVDSKDPQSVGKWISTVKTSILSVMGVEISTDNVPPLPVMHDHKIIDWINIKPFNTANAIESTIPTSALVGSICNELCTAADNFGKASVTLKETFASLSKCYDSPMDHDQMLSMDHQLQLLALAYQIWYRSIKMWYVPTVTLTTSTFTAMTQVLTTKA